MTELFDEKYNFNDDISDWDVSNVTNMNNMFYSDYAFNQPIGNWDVSKVTTMEYMFNECPIEDENKPSFIH